MPIRRDPVLGLTSQRNIPQFEVLNRRAKNVSDLISATPDVDRVVVITDRDPVFWEKFEPALAIPDDREIKVELVHPKDVGQFEASSSDMVLFDRYSPGDKNFTDEKLVDLLRAPNMQDAGYRGVWQDYQRTNVLGLPALAQKIELQASGRVGL